MLLKYDIDRQLLKTKHQMELQSLFLRESNSRMRLEDLHDKAFAELDLNQLDYTTRHALYEKRNLDRAELRSINMEKRSVLKDKQAMELIGLN